MAETSPASATSSVTSVVASITVISAMLYLIGLHLLSQRMPKDEKIMNKRTTFRLQRSAPFAYLLVVLSSLAEISVSSWLTAQYKFNHNYPNQQTRIAVYVTLSCACWTCVTTGIYLVLFIHPRWCEIPVISLGAQAVWIIFTWAFWITCTAVLNQNLPFIVESAHCTLVYCGQLQALFALAVTQIVLLSLAMFVVVWLSWRSMSGH